MHVQQFICEDVGNMLTLEGLEFIGLMVGGWTLIRVY